MLTMAGLMMDDILDIGSSRWRGNIQEMEGITSHGAPTQFMLPQCDNVRIKALGVNFCIIRSVPWAAIFDKEDVPGPRH